MIAKLIKNKTIKRRGESLSPLLWGYFHYPPFYGDDSFPMAGVKAQLNRKLCSTPTSAFQKEKEKFIVRHPYLHL